ncbi:MAG TPA: transposase [Pyrinomonadaceae bacterium]|jgi:REP element-mobilizing transposase RayT
MFKENDEWDDNIFPLAYLITIRTYGRWLHGDERNSVDIHGRNIYGTPDLIANKNLETLMRKNMQQRSVILNKEQRNIVEEAIKEVCRHRRYDLQAVNVRSNHLHAVVSAQIKPEIIADAFKKYATRKLREENLISKEISVWSRGRSRRYLWKPRHVALAIEYVLNEQDDVPFEIDE